MNVPDVSHATNLDLWMDKVEQWLEQARKEQARRDSLTDAQWLAERLNFALSREPGEAWYYEFNDWTAPEHARWLKKAEKLLATIPDKYEALQFARDLLLR